MGSSFPSCLRSLASLALITLGLVASSPVGAQEAHEQKAGGAAPAAAGDTHAAGGNAEAGGHAEAPAKGEHPHIYLAQSVWAIASFVVVALILLKKAFPPILKAMDKRAADIRDALAAAEKAKAEAQELMSRHEASLEKARKEAAAIIDEGKADALKVKDSIVQSAKKEAEEVAARARRDIEQAKVAAIDDLTRRSIQLSLELASRLVKKNLNESEQQGLIQDTIRSLPAA